MATSIETSATETSIPNDNENTNSAEAAASLAAAASCGIVGDSNESFQNNTEAETLKDSINLSEMESSLESNNFPVDDIPEPIKVLDDIISEFEEASRPAIVANAENQSEDDGYMSLSRKNMRKNDSEEASLTSLNRASRETSNLEIKTNGELCSSNENVKHELESLNIDQSLIQTTLPKARTSSTSTIQTNYSSLPCCGARSSIFAGGDMASKQTRTGSINSDRNVLGIDISAVHKAVLRGGVAKLPEPIVNEHPVTIYPGRYSPPPSAGEILRGSANGASNRPLRLMNSVEKHREVCQLLKPLSSKSSSSSSSPRSISESSALKHMEIRSLSYKKGHDNKIINFQTAKNRNCNETEDEDDSEAEEEEEEDFSEDSVDAEQSSLSMSAELTEKPNKSTKKHASVAWEIHFNNERTANHKTQSSAPKSSSKRPQKKASYSAALPVPVPEKSFGVAYSNAIYSLEPEEEFTKNVYDEQQQQQQDCTDYGGLNESLNYYAKHSNLAGGKGGTYVIRRNTANRTPVRAVDIFYPSNSIEIGSEVSKKVSKSPTTTQACQENESKYLYDSGMDRKPRTSSTNSRDRLSLNIDVHGNKNLIKTNNDTNPNASKAKKYSEDFKYLHADKQQDIELRKENDNIINDYNSIGNFVAFNCSNGSNSLKNNDFTSIKSMDVHSASSTTTPHTDLAPTIEEDEECSDLSYSGAILPSSCSTPPHMKQLQDNTNARLRGELAVQRIGDISLPKRPLEFRPGVHKSESAKEMLLSQGISFGPLPPSPPPITSSSKPNLLDYDALPLPPLPPLPPSPAAVSSETDDDIDDKRRVPIAKAPYLHRTTSVEVHSSNSGVVEERRCISSSRERSTDRREREREKKRCTTRHMSDDLPLPPTGISFEHMAPAVPPHRGHSANTMKSWSIDSNYRRKSSRVIGGSMGGYYGGCGGSGMTTPTSTHHGVHPSEMLGGGHSAKRFVSHGTKRSTKQSPREEHRGSLQTSCSLPETPIFARGCDVPRTPFRRTIENPVTSGSRTAPRSSTSISINMGTTLPGLGVGGNGSVVASMCRQRSISHALASNEMLRMSGVPARGWYPKQRSMRPASTENIDRLTTMRVWDCATTNIGASGTSSRKPLTLPPNLTPSFLNKSPREALRRVTSLLITKKKNGKERKARPYYEDTIDGIMPYDEDTSKHKSSSDKDAKHETNCNSSALPKAPKPPKKKSLFKNLWKRTKHFSLDQ